MATKIWPQITQLNADYIRLAPLAAEICAAKIIICANLCNLRLHSYSESAASTARTAGP